MSLAIIKTASSKADTGETFDIHGANIQFLTAVSNADNDYCLIRSTFPAGMMVPPAKCAGQTASDIALVVGGGAAELKTLSGSQCCFAFISRSALRP
jgi:hypothetical protein